VWQTRDATLWSTTTGYRKDCGAQAEDPQAILQSLITREKIKQNSQQKQDFELYTSECRTRTSKQSTLNKGPLQNGNETSLFISSTGIYITSPLQRQCSSRTPKQHSDQQQIAPSSFIVRLAPIKNESNTENYL